MVHLRTWTKLSILLVFAAFIMVGTISYAYKPIYSVSLDGEFIGYTENKKELQGSSSF